MQLLLLIHETFIQSSGFLKLVGLLEILGLRPHQLALNFSDLMNPCRQILTFVCSAEAQGTA